MVKRRKVCRRRRVMVGRNRCALVDCHNNIVKGRVKCRRKVAGKARRARVVTKRRPCRCKPAKRRVVQKTKRRKSRKSRKVPCSKHPMMKKCRGKKRKVSRRSKRRSYL